MTQTFGPQAVPRAFLEPFPAGGDPLPEPGRGCLPYVQATVGFEDGDHTMKGDARATITASI